jgi:hypothetical protein
MSGDQSKAREYSGQLVQMCEKAGADERPELAEARKLWK